MNFHPSSFILSVPLSPRLVWSDTCDLVTLAVKVERAKPRVFPHFLLRGAKLVADW
jgi:hypothetical protein